MIQGAAVPGLLHTTANFPWSRQRRTKKDSEWGKMEWEETEEGNVSQQKREDGTKKNGNKKEWKRIRGMTVREGKRE